MKIAMPPNDTKMRELILHVAKKSENDDKFGAVKLNKILFYADFYSFVKRGKPITGLEYFALSEGPAPRQMLPIIKSMEAAKDIAIKKVSCGRPNPKSVVVALRDPDYSKLDAEDVVIADFIIEKFKGMTGTDLTNMSHEFSGWLSAFYDHGEKTTIPYSSARFDVQTFEFLGIEKPPLAAKFIEHGIQLSRKLAKGAT